MFKHILVPADLAHPESVPKAVQLAADSAKHYGASLTLVGVTASAPTEIAHTPEEFGKKLSSYAAEQGARHGVDIKAKTVVSHDPAVDLDDTLRREIDEQGADLVVMASHVPGFADYLHAANAVQLAAHTETSIFIVR